MHPYSEEILRRLMERRNPKRAVEQSAYFKDQFVFLGVGQPEAKGVVKDLVQGAGLPPVEDLKEIVNDLWECGYREGNNAAIELMVRMVKKLPESFIDFAAELVTRHSWWETVDGISCWILGPLLKKFPDKKYEITQRWIDSGNMWSLRSAIIFQNSYKKDTDLDLLFHNVKQGLHSNEFFIRKGIGWALRSAGDHFPKEIIEFCETHEMSPLSRKEALRKII